MTARGPLLGAAVVCLLATAPLLWIALSHLAGREYVAGALVVFAAAAVGHLGLELLTLSPEGPTLSIDDEESAWPPVD